MADPNEMYALQRSLQEKMLRYQSLVRKMNTKGLDGVLVKPRQGMIAVGGPRNRSGALPAELKTAITAAYKAAIRAEKACSEWMRVNA